MQTILKVFAEWDNDANVWVAQSDDVPGLVTEGETFQILVEKLKVMIPELLDENGYADGEPEIPFEVQANCRVMAHSHAH